MPITVIVFGNIISHCLICITEDNAYCLVTGVHLYLQKNNVEMMEREEAARERAVRTVLTVNSTDSWLTSLRPP